MEHICKPRTAVLLIGLAALAGCGSGSTTARRDTTPLPGHVYIYAGRGSAGYGAMDTPVNPELYWPVDVGFSPQGAPLISIGTITG